MKYRNYTRTKYAHFIKKKKKSYPYLQCVGVLVTELVHLGDLLLALLESPEVVLDEEGCVELTHRYVVVSCFKGGGGRN